MDNDGCLMPDDRCRMSDVGLKCPMTDAGWKKG